MIFLFFEILICLCAYEYFVTCDELEEHCATKVVTVYLEAVRNINDTDHEFGLQVIPCSGTLLTTNAILTSASCTGEWNGILLPDRQPAYDMKAYIMEDGVVVQQSTVIKQHVHPQWNVTLKDSNLAFLIIEPRFAFPAPLGQMRFVEESDLPMKTKRDFPFKSYSTQNKEELVTIYYNGNRCPVLIDGKLQNETMWHLFLCSPHIESTHIKLCADDIGGIVYKRPINSNCTVLVGVLSHVYNTENPYCAHGCYRPYSGPFALDENGTEPLYNNNGDMTPLDCNISFSYIKFTALDGDRVNWLRKTLFLNVETSLFTEATRCPNLGNRRPRTQSGGNLTEDEYYDEDLYLTERNSMVHNERVCSGTIRLTEFILVNVFLWSLSILIWQKTNCLNFCIDRERKNLHTSEPSRGPEPFAVNFSVLTLIISYPI